MKPELNREYPTLDDPDVFERMVALTIHQMQMVNGQLRRGQHAKPTGSVMAEFRVTDDVPVGLISGCESENSAGTPGCTSSSLRS